MVKVLIVIGVRLDKLAKQKTLSLDNVEPVLVLPMYRSNGMEIAKVLHRLKSKLGSLRLVVADEGSDLKAGINLYRKEHPELDYVPDIAHKLARFLKGELKNDEAWHELSKRGAETRTRLLQTDLAHLIPPKGRDKARYLNLEELIKWACRILFLFEHEDLSHAQQKVMITEFTWLYDLKPHILEFQQLWLTLTVTRSIIRNYGISKTSLVMLQEALKKLPLDLRASLFASRITHFVIEQTEKVHGDEVLLASSEVLESLIGRLKHRLRTQSRSGFTSSCLLASSLCGNIDEALLTEALEQTHTKDLAEWSKEYIGLTVQHRRKAFHKFTSPSFDFELKFGT